MKSFSPLVRAATSLCLLAIGIGGYYWMGTPTVETRPPAAKEIPVVATAVAVEHTDGIKFIVDGVVVPFRQVEIATEVGGRIAFKSEQCRTGRAVKKGDLLVQIDKRDYELEVTRLGEELTQARAMLKELDVEMVSVVNQVASTQEHLKIDVRQVERNRDLLLRSAASDLEVDTARRAELTTRSSLQTLLDQKNLIASRRTRMESAIVLGRANLDKAELALERTEIRSPLDGVVVRENVEQDGFVQQGSTVISLQDTSRLDVTCKLHMRQMYWLWQSQFSSPLDNEPGSSDNEPGSPDNEIASADIEHGSPDQGNGAADSEQELTVDLARAYDFPDTPATILFTIGGTTYRWKGLVDRYDGGGIDSQTRMVPCRVHVEDPLSVVVSSQDGDAISGMHPPTLMTGMFVKVMIDARPPLALVRLPQEAIQPGNTVWTVEERQLHRKEISIATSDSKYAVVFQRSGGLQAGDAVVVSPLAMPIEGLEVTVLSGQEQVGSQGQLGSQGQAQGKGRAGGSASRRSKPVTPASGGHSGERREGKQEASS